MIRGYRYRLIWTFSILNLLWFSNSGAANFTSELSSTFQNENVTILCVHIGKGEVECNGTVYENKAEETDEPGSLVFWGHLFVSSGLVLFAGLMSGLTLGLLSMDATNLEILQRSGTPQERAYASRIMPIVKRHHLLLVTLLLCNAAAMEALPIFLEKLVDPFLAIVISVTLVLFFGEVIPQAVCQRYGLAIGAYLFWLVWFLIGVCFIVAWPVSKLLDWLLGSSHATFFRRAELKELVAIHQRHKKKELHEEPLSSDEVKMIRGALELKSKTVDKVMIPIDKVFMLNANEKLDKSVRDRIVRSGRSRIPVFNGTRSQIVGYLLTKSLVKIDASTEPLIGTLPLRPIPRVSSYTKLFTLLRNFRSGHSHIAVVVDSNEAMEPIGVITLEDVLEELLQDEIRDETDTQERQSSTVSSEEVNENDPSRHNKTNEEKTNANNTHNNNNILIDLAPPEPFDPRAEALVPLIRKEN